MARRPRSITQKWPPFAGSKMAPCRSSHRLNSALVTCSTYVFITADDKVNCRLPCAQPALTLPSSGVTERPKRRVRSRLPVGSSARLRFGAKPRVNGEKQHRDEAAAMAPTMPIRRRASRCLVRWIVVLAPLSDLGNRDLPPSAWPDFRARAFGRGKAFPRIAAGPPRAQRM